MRLPTRDLTSWSAGLLAGLAILLASTPTVLSAEFANSAEWVLESSGEIGVDLVGPGFRLDASLHAGLQAETWRFGALADLSDGAWTGFSLEAAAVIGETAATASTTFDPTDGSFLAAEAMAVGPLQGVVFSTLARLEPGALGAAVSVEGDGSAPLQAAEIGFNLSPFGEIQTESCALAFSYASAAFTLPIGECEETAEIEILWDCDGFVEFAASVAEVGALPFGMQFGGFLSFTPEEKMLEISPAFSLDSPDCFDLYAGILWDSDANRLDGFKLYGIGFRSEAEGLRLRGLYALSPNEIALVPDPYTALFGAVWDTAGCCGKAGEGSVAFLFGDEGLFDLGEVLGELVLPIIDTVTVTLGFSLPTAGPPTLTVGWDAAF